MFLPYFGLATVKTNGIIVDIYTELEKNTLMDKWFM